MTVNELLSELVRLGLNVSVDGGKLKLSGPKEALTPELIRALSERKPEILAAFQGAKGRTVEAIPRASRDADLPLSDVQQELWLAEQLTPGSVTRRVAAGFQLTGSLDVAALQQSLGEVLARHEALRTTFTTRGGKPVQVVHEEATAELSVVDALPASSPFDLEHGPLFRTWLIRRSDTDHILYIAAHHLIFDVESVWLLMRELAAVYDGTRVGKLPIQYADFAAWQRARGVSDEGAAYWQGHLEDATALLDLPTDRPRQSNREFRCRRERATLSRELSDALVQASRREGVTRFVFMLAAFSLWAGRCAGQKDVLVGSPVSGRTHPDTEKLIGSFAYPLVLRADLSGDCTFLELLARVHRTTLAAFEHQDVPFGRVLELAQPERLPGASPLFQVMFTQPPRQRPIELPGLTITPIHDLLEATVEYDWMLSAVEGTEGLELSFTWPDDLFDDATARRMSRDFQDVLKVAIADPGVVLWEPAPSDAESIALAPIEAALRAAPSVADCAVLARGGHELTAYVVPAGRFVESEIRGHLAGRLPASLIPGVYVAVSQLPLTADGAIDAKALSRVQESPVRQTSLHLSDLLEEQAEAPDVVPTTAGTADLASRPMALNDGGPLIIPEDAPRTLTEALVRTAARHPERRITYVDGHGNQVQQSFATLLEEAKEILAGLRAAGFRPKDRVILQIGSLRDHFTVFWGCVLGGIVPVTVAIAPSYQEKSGVVNKLFNTSKLLEEPAILTSSDLAPAIAGLSSILPMDGIRIVTIDSLRGHGVAHDLYPAIPDDLVFFQLSSGSTGTPKCIQERHRGIIAHIHGAQQFNGYREDDVNLNWLPVDHVVPILTCHLKDIYLGCEEVQARAELILSNPARWFDLIEHFRVTHTWAPNFGYKLAADHIRANGHRQWDLSSVKCFMNAGEQVTVPVVHDFLEAVAPFGVRTGAMQPSFGMAEACTCMTFRNDFDLETGHRRILKSSLPGGLQLANGTGEPAVSFVDLGPAVPGVRIRITDSQNRLVPEGVIGRFQIHGDVITPGYLNNEEANREAFVGDGWFNSGDLGFMWDGRLFLTGREKETIIIRGANFYCYEIEDVVNGIEGMEPTFSAACSVPNAESGTEELAIFFVPKPGADRHKLAQTVRVNVARSLGISPAVVVPLEKAEFPKTTSGKIQRNQLKKALEAGHFKSQIRDVQRQLGNSNTLPDWFYRKVWRPRELKLGEAPSRVLVFDDARLAPDVVARLTAQGTECVRARAGEPLDFPIEQILFLSPLDSAQESLSALLRLAQALQKVPGEVRLLLVTDSRQENAGLSGLLKTIPRELANVRCRSLELESVDGGAELVVRELCANDREEEVAWRGGRRLVSRLRRLRPLKRPSPFRKGGTYLVSGGAGGIGSEIARYLVQRYQCKLIVVGRRANASAQFSSVRYVQADVCDVAQLRRAVADERLDGILHLAGVMEERALADETPETFASAMRAKVEGARSLHELVKDKPGTLFVHFSSVNGFFGGFRVGAYSAANAFLDAFAQYQRESCGLRAYSLAWSMWSETGVSRGYPYQELSRNRGFHSMPPRLGIQSLLVALQQEPMNLLIGLDPTKPDVRRHVEGKPYRLSSLRSESDGTQVPRDEKERQIAAIWREILQISEVGVSDNFFDLGGHSMLLLQMHVKLVETLGTEFPMLDLLSHPTIRTLATHLGREKGIDASTTAGQARAALRKQAAARRSAEAVPR